MDDTPNVPGALSLIAEHLPKWWADEGTKDLRDGLSNFVPTDAVDAGLMLVGGPGGKMARKAGAALIAGGASTDAEAGIFKKLPGELRGLVRLLAANAKKADPAEAAIEFANNGLGGKLARGGHGVVDSSKLVFNPNGAALHTHGYAEQALPSFKDFETWAAQPAQKYLGVVKPSRQGKPGAVIIAPKGSALPAQGELAQFQKSLFKSNPNLVNRLDFGESDASKWKWLLDKANADELDLFLHNTTAPAELMYPGYKTPKATLDELLQASLEQKGSRGEDALLSYLSDGYEDINAALRNGEGADEVARNMDKLFSANEGVRPLENDLAVWRYSTSFPKHDPAFLSTTLSEEFARKNAGAGQVKKIIVPAGERAFDTRNVAPYAYEQEVLLPRGGNLTPIDENTLMFNRAEQGYSQGGAVNKPQGMEHTTSSSQDASTQPLTGSALKALVRGWIAGTAGLPGDIEGLARKGVNWSFGPGGVNVDEAPALPTSEFYKDWLPGKQQGDEMINDIGSVFGGVGATKPVSLTKGALSRVAAAAPGPMAGSRAAMRGVIKAPGGNWLSGSVEDALNGLKRGDFEAIAQLQRVRPGLSVEEARAFIQAPPPSAENVALNNFVDKQLTRYVQKDMATERDPIRALAERGVLHYEPRAPSQTYQDMLMGKRVKEGFPAEGSSASELARRYETASDRAVTNGTYRDNRRFGASLEDDLRKLGGDYAIQNPDAKAYGFDKGVSAGRDLGFDHLMDELRNAVNINSGLPAHLRLDPESLARVSVPQAVERVAKINDWRAAQKVAADQARANNAATVLHKEYPEGNYFRAGEGSFFTPDQQAAELFGKNFGGKVGRHRLDPKKTATEADLEKVVREYGVLQEGVPLGQYLEQGDNAVTPYSSFIRGALRKQGFDSVSLNDGMAKQPSLVALDDSIIKPHTDNPKGFKWMELKSGDLPEGWSQRKDALGVDMVYGPDGYSTNAGSIKDPRRAALADALKYEGDTMGHCVGGYCDDVASGKSRIFSLRDAKGQPHTTIEVSPSRELDPNHEMIPQVILDEASDANMALEDYLASKHPQFMAAPKIVQIKGKANKAPNPEYLPFVQDFVKSGKWSDVGDLQNTGLRKSSDAFNSVEMEKLRSLGVEDIPQWVTGEDLNNLSGKLGSGLKYDASGRIISGYADGGSVRNALNAAVGGSGLAKAVGNTERAVGNIASGNASLGDLKSLRDMASQLGYTVPGLSQALGIAGVAKAGYNMASDPSGMNAAKLAATVNPIAAQALGLYQAATDPTPGTLVDAVSSFNPIARAYNGLANSFNFATVGQVLSNLSKIADPNTPAQLRDMFSNTPLKDGFNREQAEIDAMGPTVQDAINAYNQAQALQTNPSLNPASPDFMGPQADGGAGYTGVTSGGHGGDGSVGGYGSNSYGGAASSVGGSGGYGGYA